MSPVRKYKTHEEAHRDRRLEPGDPRIPEHLLQLFDLWERLCPLARPLGVFKFRSIDEAKAFRQSWPKRSRGESD